MARQTVRIDGLRDLERALAELPKATGKNVLRRTIRKAAEPMLLRAASLAPTFRLDLVESMGISSKLGKRQGKMHKRMFRDDRAAVELFLGTGVLPQAHLQEFGTERHGPQSFMRPAWDAEKKPTLDRIVATLADEIAKAAQRLARKAARLAARG